MVMEWDFLKVGSLSYLKAVRMERQCTTEASAHVWPCARLLNTFIDIKPDQKLDSFGPILKINSVSKLSCLRVHYLQSLRLKLCLSVHYYIFKYNTLSKIEYTIIFKASLVAQMVKSLPAMQETQVQSLGLEDPLEKEMATHSSTLAWRIPWTEQPGKTQSTELQRVGHKWVTNISFSFHIILYFRRLKTENLNMSVKHLMQIKNSLGNSYVHMCRAVSVQIHFFFLDNSPLVILLYFQLVDF